jgi:hypothetical protein
MNIDQALHDPNIFGSLRAFRDLSSWAVWRVALKAIYGLPLTSDEKQTFRKHTGRSKYDPPPGGWGEVVFIIGRQSGKTRITATILDFAAIASEHEPDGTDLYALAIAQDHRASLRALFSYAKAPFESVPMLSSMIVGQTADTLQLNNGTTISAYPCRPAAIRGLRACVVVLDELAYYRSSENLPQDVEMLRAVRPTLATTGGKLIILSSPGGQSGALYEMHRAHYGRDESLTLVWQASAPDMNPTLRADYLARMKQDDPDAYRSEVLGEFRAGVTTFFDPDVLALCVDEGVRERAPQPDITYSGFYDAASGTKHHHDRAVATVSYLDPATQLAVIAAQRLWAPPFNPLGVQAEACDFFRSYRISTVYADRYAVGFVAEQFRANGITYVPSELSKSELYLEMLPLINSGRARLLDQPELLRELRGLERRRSSSGRDTVDHAPRAHDDAANACAGALWLAAKGSGIDAAQIEAVIALNNAIPRVAATPSIAGASDLERLQEQRRTDRAINTGDEAPTIDWMSERF